MGRLGNLGRRWRAWEGLEVEVGEGGGGGGNGAVWGGLAWGRVVGSDPNVGTDCSLMVSKPLMRSKGTSSGRTNAFFC